MSKREFVDGAFYWVLWSEGGRTVAECGTDSAGSFVFAPCGSEYWHYAHDFAEIGPCLGKGPAEGDAVAAIVAWLKGDRRGIYEGRYLEDTGDLFDAIVEEIERGTPFTPPAPRS